MNIIFTQVWLGFSKPIFQNGGMLTLMKILFLIENSISNKKVWPFVFAFSFEFFVASQYSWLHIFLLNTELI